MRDDALDWEDLMLGWNSQHGTKYQDVREWLAVEITECKSFAERLGIGIRTLYFKRKSLNLPTPEKPNTKKQKLLELAKAKGLNAMTFNEIQRAVGPVAPSWLYKIMSDHGLQYRRVGEKKR